MRVLAAGGCAAASETRPGTKPVAAAPIKNLLRAGCVGACGGSQHTQARTSLRRSELADIASLVIRPTLTVARTCFQARRVRAYEDRHRRAPRCNLPQR